MKFCCQKIVFICLIITLGGILLFPNIGLSAETSSLSKEEIKNHLIFPEKDAKQLLHTLIGTMSEEWENLKVSGSASEEEMLVPLIIRQGLQIDTLKYLLLDAPVETMEMVIRASIQIASTMNGIMDARSILEIIEKQTVKMAVDYGLKALLQNEIMVAPGALEIKYISKKGNSQQAVFQYILVFNPTIQKQGEVNIEIYSPQSLEPPKSTGSLGIKIGTPNALETDLPPFVIKVQGNVEKGEFDAYRWVGTPNIEITFPDNVPDLGFRPLSFWQRHLWQPIESQIREATVLLNRFLAGGSSIVDGISNLWQKIGRAGSAVKNTATNLFSKISNYLQGVNTGASIAGFVYPDLPNPDFTNIFSNNNAATEQLTTVVEPTKPPETIFPNETTAPPDQLAILQAQLNALIEQIDNIAEDADMLFANQNQTTSRNSASGDNVTASNAPSQTSMELADATSTLSVSPGQATTSTLPQNTILASQLTSNQPTIVPPSSPTQILISEVKTESQNSASDEYIELYNPNNFAVNLGGLILRKKTISSASESTLVSSSKFQGNIAAFGYFLITPQSTTTGNLHYSGAGYYIAQTNSILLYDRYERLLDKAENVVHPATHSLGRKLTGFTNPAVKYQQTSSSAADFETQTPTPMADNQQDQTSPQILLLSHPDSTTTATSAEFAFSTSEPGCSITYQLDQTVWQTYGGSSPVKLTNLAMGQRNFKLKAADPVGNISNVLQYSWTIVAIATSAPATSSPATPPATSTPATTTPATTTPATSTPPALLITEIQIRDASSTDNDFVEIFNPNNQAIDITDFQLKKQTSTGTSTGYSLRVFPASSTIPASGYFLWTNTNYSFPDDFIPDATSTQTLSSNNSVALFYSDHTAIIDQVAWGSSTNPFVETTPFPQNPGEGQTLTRQKDGSDNYIDTNNNSVDFVLASPTPTNSQGQTPSASSGQATSTPATSTPATTTPATSTPATSTPTFDPSLPVITDLEAAAAADRNAVDLWWNYVNASGYLINYNNQTIHFTASDIQNIITATVEDLTGGVAATFTVQYIDSNGATSGPSNIATATPLFGFQDNNDGTINDLYSGLMWPKDGSGLAANNGQPLTWFEAKDFCEQLVMCGNGEFATTTDPVAACAGKGDVKYDDWRLPNIKELATLIKYQKNPADGIMIDTNYFQNMAAGKYWSASFKHYNDWRWNLWYVRWFDLSNGFINMETLETTSSEVGYFLPVRGDSAVISTSGFDEPQTGCSLGFQDNGDGTFTDLCSGLMWTNSFSGDTVFWVRAMENARDATIFGHNDWHLPNIRELLMIINNPYQGSPNVHWTITPDYQQQNKKWVADLAAMVGQTQTESEGGFNYFRFVRNP